MCFPPPPPPAKRFVFFRECDWIVDEFTHTLSPKTCQGAAPLPLSHCRSDCDCSVLNHPIPAPQSQSWLSAEGGSRRRSDGASHDGPSAENSHGPSATQQPGASPPRLTSKGKGDARCHAAQHTRVSMCRTSHRCRWCRACGTSCRTSHTCVVAASPAESSRTSVSVTPCLQSCACGSLHSGLSHRCLAGETSNRNNKSS